MAVSAAGVALFVAVQLHLRAENWRLITRSAAASGHPPSAAAEVHWVATQFGEDLLVYAGLACAATILVRLGYRYLWALPPLAYTLAPVVAGPGHDPAIIGHAWYIFGLLTRAPWYGTWRIAAAIDLVLALIPAAAWLGSVERRRRRDWDFVDLLGATVALGSAALVVRTSHVVTGQMPLPEIVWSVGVFAALASTARPWWPWATVLVAALVSGWAGELVADLSVGSFSLGGVLSDLWGATVDASPILLSAVAVSCWEPLSTAMRRSEESPVALLITVNVLNVADAVFTQFAIRTGQAAELNPLVRSIGLPAKVVGVGLLSWILYRKRPALLLIPAAALLLVLAYHVSGLVIDT